MHNVSLFVFTDDGPTVAQIVVANGILADARACGQISSGYILYGKRQVGATECPDNNLFAEIRSWPLPRLSCLCYIMKYYFDKINEYK